MKYCNKCKTTKSFDSFAHSKNRKDSLAIYCKSCNNNYKKLWQKDNKEKVAAYDKEWQQKNKDKKSSNYKNWQTNNRAKVNSYNSYRRALEKQATPKWLTDSHKLHMECKYSLAVMLSNNTEEQHHVDHIVPLNGKAVCGLHVPWNLQILSAQANFQKGNKLVI